MLKIIFLLSALITFTLVASASEETSFEELEIKRFAAMQVLGILDKLEQMNWEDNQVRFGLLIVQFLIKQKVYLNQLTAEDMQLFYNIYQKIEMLKEKHKTNKYGHQTLLFQNAFQVHLLLKNTTLRTGLIDSHLPYTELMYSYENVFRTGLPQGRHSDFCMVAISTMGFKDCSLPDACLSLFISDLPSYGYPRTHQLILLYMFLHHKCAPAYGSEQIYIASARRKCTEVYREQQAIRALGLPLHHLDLFLEQNVVCGAFFGYGEFLNWRRVAEVSTWTYAGPCDCSNTYQLQPLHCACHHHIDSVALAYYTSALTLL